MMIYKSTKIFLFLLLCTLIVSATVTNQKIEIKKGSSASLDNKNITIISISRDSAVLLDVDGQRDKIKKGASDTISCVDIGVIDVFDTESALLNVSIPFTCGNKVCEASENSKSCCTDCNCSGTSVCSQNRCIITIKKTCAVNEDCNDKNKCTQDICDPLTKLCSNSAIKVCQSNDGCCPFGCNNIVDNDCKITICTSDKECDDKNKCTENFCSNGSCKYEGSDCELDGKCNPIGIIVDSKYCFERTWYPLKKVNSTCINDYECLSDSCKDKKCSERGLLLSKKVEKNVNSYAYTLMIFLALIIILEIIILIKKKH